MLLLRNGGRCASEWTVWLRKVEKRSVVIIKRINLRTLPIADGQYSCRLGVFGTDSNCQLAARIRNIVHVRKSQHGSKGD